MCLDLRMQSLVKGAWSNQRGSRTSQKSIEVIQLRNDRSLDQDIDNGDRTECFARYQNPEVGMLTNELGGGSQQMEKSGTFSVDAASFPETGDGWGMQNEIRPGDTDVGVTHIHIHLFYEY